MSRDVPQRAASVAPH